VDDGNLLIKQDFFKVFRAKKACRFGPRERPFQGAIGAPAA